MKDTAEAHIGDTFCLTAHRDVPQLPGFLRQKPVVYAGVYPMDSGSFVELQDSMSKLLLTDNSVSVTRTSSPALGPGFHCGFLGVFENRQILTESGVVFKVESRQQTENDGMHIVCECV